MQAGYNALFALWARKSSGLIEGGPPTGVAR